MHYLSMSALVLVALSSGAAASPIKELMDLTNYVTSPLKAIRPLRNPNGGTVVGRCNFGQLYCFNQIVYDLSKHSTSSPHHICT